MRPDKKLKRIMKIVHDVEESGAGWDSGILVANMMFHSNEATAGMSPYHATAEEVDGFLARLSGYLEAVFSRFEVKPVGLSDLAAVQ